MRPAFTVTAFVIATLIAAGWPFKAGGKSALELTLPLDCRPGENCWIPRYVDLDPGNGIADYACASHTGDGHNGTDFAIANDAVMRQGVPVLAAAAGRVAAIRDGVEDVNVDEIGLEAVDGIECGNGVRIDHGNGWETQYCHLMLNSIAVSEGEWVEQADKLGLVGLSGETSFPHVHLTVRKRGKVIDPFTGEQPQPNASCEASANQLWRPELHARLTHQAVIIRNVGFAGRVIDWRDIKDGVLSVTEFAKEADALVIAIDGFHIKKGDRIELRIQGPNGWMFENAETIERGRAAFMRFGGRRAPEGGFEAGTYHGFAHIFRPGAGEIAHVSVTIELR